MRSACVMASLVLAFSLGGCGYIHFGRLPPTDAALNQAYSDSLLQRKILQQELVLARTESDTLRNALEKAQGAASLANPNLAGQLEDTTRELATLRASYARLQAERAAPAAIDQATRDQVADLQAKLAASTRDYAQVQGDNARLHRELDAARAESASLAEKLQSSLAETRQAQTSLAQTDSELRTEKANRTQAEQAVEALRAQLQAVMARAGRADSAQSSATALGPDKGIETTPNPLAALQLAKAPPSGAVPTAELRTSAERIRNLELANPPAPASFQPATTTGPAEAAAAPATPPTPTATRTYTVQSGDTLETIAERVYGAASEWHRLYAANTDLLAASGGLKPGMQLTVPER